MVSSNVCFRGNRRPVQPLAWRMLFLDISVHLMEMVSTSVFAPATHVPHCHM